MVAFMFLRPTFTQSENIDVRLLLDKSTSTCTNDRLDLHIGCALAFLKSSCTLPAPPWIGIYHIPPTSSSSIRTLPTSPFADATPLAKFHLCTERVKTLLKLQKELAAPNEPRQVIWCSLDADLCKKPTAVEAIGRGLFGAPHEDPSNSLLTITFDQSTNMPNVEGNKGVESVLSFSEKVGTNYTGIWTSPRTLEIILTNATGGAPRIKLGLGKLQVYFVAKIPDNDVINAEKENRRAKLKEGMENIETGRELSRRSLRLSLSGQHVIVIHHSVHPGSERVADQVNIEHCGDLVLGRSSSANLLFSQVSTADADSLTVKHDVETMVFPLPELYAPSGVFSMDGTRSVRLPNIMLEPHRDGWSVSMWLFLTEDSTGKHRGLFYKVSALELLY